MTTVTALDQLRVLLQHRTWSDEQLFDALRVSDPYSADAQNEYAHIIGAEEVWLSRIEGRPSRSAVWPKIPLGELADLRASVRQGYETMLAGLAPEAIGREIAYSNSAGQHFVTPLSDILLHVMLHGQYHRGKVNVLLRVVHLAAVPVDYISFTRGMPAATQRQMPERVRTLILPGLYDSGPDHWQSRWQELDSTCERVIQRDWATPLCDEWVATLDAAICSSSRTVVLVGHSSSCGMVAHWAGQASAEQLAKVRGAFLAAPSDPLGPAYPEGPVGFAPVPMEHLPFPSIVVASNNDEYVTLAQARAYASAWGSEFVELGAAGHINGASGLGDWNEGYEMLDRLRRAPTAR